MAYAYIAHANAFAAVKMYILGAVRCLVAVQGKTVVDESQMRVQHAGIGNLEAPAVNLPAAADGNVFLPDGEEEGGPAGHGIDDIIPWIQRP